jgi:diacylglycerol kinase (ATP)
MNDPQRSSQPPAKSARVAVILNPTAGKGRGGAELVRMRHLLARREIDAEVFLTRAEGDSTRILSELLLPPGSLVVAVGGDGTAHEVGSALVGKEGVSLGVVPVGSGNDYAALLGMPSRPVDALEAILRGHDERWDVGMVGSQPFLNTVGFGFSASVSYYSRNTGPLRGLPRYLLATVRALSRFHPLSVALDGLPGAGHRSITLLEVGIGNRCGGGFRLTTKADPADGLLDVCLVEAMPRARILLVLPRGLKGTHLGHPLVQYDQVSGFRLRIESDTIIHVDGEIRILPKGEHSLRVKPKALQVRLPGASAEPDGAVDAAAPAA